jgi:D-alanine-D-alanine ligase
MRKASVLILFSLPTAFFPDGSPDPFGQESVLSRLQAVEEALRSLGHSVKRLEPKGNLSSFLIKLLESRVDLVFNLCEEFLGQTQLEMNVAALLEMMGIPFTGSSALTLGLSQDKGKTKSILAHHGIPTPSYRVWLPGDDDLLSDLQFPLIVKPLREDASLGIDNDALVWDQNALQQQMQKVYRLHGQAALIEEYIEGRELNVSILGNEPPQILPISEIDFSTMPSHLPKICGYASKWVESSLEFTHTLPRCPALLPSQIEEKVINISLSAYRIMDCRDYARVDIRLSPAGIPYVLEVNANPDISPDAGMTRSARIAGFTYPEFIARILELVQARSMRIRPLRRSRKASSKKEPRV